MGTVFSLDIRPPLVDPAAIDEAVAWLHHVDETFSTYRADSAISRLARGELALDAAQAEVREILDRCTDLERETSGYFSAYATGHLDPSGLVKGWAIEHASDLLRAAGSSNHCVNGGGDVQCAGNGAPGQPWRVGIAHPLRHGELVATVAGTGLAVATSGSTERGAHIIDPHTREAPDAFASVTVIGPRLAAADAYATAAYAMGAAAREWLSTLPGHEAFVVTAEGRSWCTDGLRGAS
jgi:thiamine biosynthesis lipoprotein